MVTFIYKEYSCFPLLFSLSPTGKIPLNETAIRVNKAFI